jgi:hypothetical protein
VAPNQCQRRRSSYHWWWRPPGHRRLQSLLNLPIITSSGSSSSRHLVQQSPFSWYPSTDSGMSGICSVSVKSVVLTAAHHWCLSSHVSRAPGLLLLADACCHSTDSGMSGICSVSVLSWYQQQLITDTCCQMCRLRLACTLLYPPLSLPLAPEWGSHSCLSGACDVM